MFEKHENKKESGFEKVMSRFRLGPLKIIIYGHAINYGFLFLISKLETPVICVTTKL